MQHLKELLACAPTGGEGIRMTQPIIKALALADVVVIGDNNPDPYIREETRKLAERSTEELNGRLFFSSEEYKDVDEWILDNFREINVLNNL